MEAKLAEGGSVENQEVAADDGRQAHTVSTKSASEVFIRRSLLVSAYPLDVHGFKRVGYWQNVIVRTVSDLAAKTLSAASARRSQTAVVEQAHTQNGGRSRGRRHAKPSNCDPQVARMGQSWDHPQEDHRGLHVRAAGRCGVRGEVDTGCKVPHHRRDYRRAGWQSWGGDRGKAFPKGNQVALASCDRGGGRSAGDPDRPLAEWLESGAPTGVACDVETAGTSQAQGPWALRTRHPQVLGTGRASCELRQCGGSTKSWSGQRSADSARWALSPCTRRGQMSSSGSEMLSCQKWQLL